MSEPIREEPSIWWQSELDNLTVGVDPLPLVGPVRVLRLLDVAGLSTMPMVQAEHLRVINRIVGHGRCGIMSWKHGEASAGL